MNFTIEKNVPLPKSKIGDKTTEALKMLDVGDSVVLHDKQSNLTGKAKNLDIRIKTRKTDKVGFYRVWRTA